MKQYKVFLITGFDKPWSPGWSYKIGFEKNGHVVLPFDPNSTLNPREKAIEMIKEFKPDIILYTKYEFPPEIIVDLKKFAKVIQWYPDVAIPEKLLSYIEIADIFFTMSEGLVEVYRQFNPKTFWLTQAFEPSLFCIKKITSEDIERFSTEVTFTGTLGTKDYYLRRRKYLSRVLKENFKLKWWGPRMPRKFSTIPLILGKLGRAYGGKFVWGEEYAKIAKLSKIFLALDATPYIYKSMSDRMYMAVGCGAFYMCQYMEGIEEVLEPEREIITFHSEQEMIEKIIFYLNKDELRRKIAEAGRKRVLAEHTYEIRIRQMLGIIENVL
jgi:spore maturation protein CgeB